MRRIVHSTLMINSGGQGVITDLRYSNWCLPYLPPLPADDPPAPVDPPSLPDDPPPPEDPPGNPRPEIPPPVREPGEPPRVTGMYERGYDAIPVVWDQPGQ